MLLSMLMLAAPTGLGDGQGVHGCPNERASEVDARFVEQGTARKCGLGITLFGLELSVGGEKCFPVRYHYPAHQVCNGEHGPGQFCAWEADLSVGEEHCACSRLGVLGTGITLPECVCTEVNGGTVEDFGTENCAIPPWAREPQPGGSL
ncbi:MAG: hypothetical protein HZA53_08510 [Planctomycetes bacterium]|nr:hypothetical protein [Planctomycetota bacterium]